jgi:hypothetical protein
MAGHKRNRRASAAVRHYFAADPAALQAAGVTLYSSCWPLRARRIIWPIGEPRSSLRTRGSGRGLRRR